MIDKDIMGVAVPSTVEKYEKGAAVFQAGTSDNLIYFLEAGLARLSATGLEGWEKTIIVLKPGNFFGEASFARKPHNYSAHAMTECSVRKIKIDQWLGAVRRNPEVALEVINSLSKRIKYLNYSATLMSFSNAMGKLAYVLYSLFKQPNALIKDGDPCIKINHEEIGRMAGLCRVTVTKTIAQFKAAGIVESSGRLIVLKDNRKLESLIVDKP